MDFENFKMWFGDNWTLVIILIAVFVYIIYYIVKRRRNKIEKEEAEKQIAQPPKRTYEPINITNTLYLAPEFQPLNGIEGNNKNFIEQAIRRCDSDIESNIKMWEDAKYRYNEIIEIEQTVKFQIQFLQEQKRMYEEMARRLK